ncbi:MAG: trypsin-like peptidase domain-containing protein [Candidatus Acidiferrales bacterium]
MKLVRWFDVRTNFALACAAAFLFAGMVPRTEAQAPPAATPTPQAPVTTEMPGSDRVHELSRNFEGLVKKVSPAVVEVLVTGYGTTDEDDEKDSSPVGRERSLGAGIIVDPEGYIITNYHVVKGADRVRVQFTPENTDEAQPFAQLRRRGRVLPAKVVGFSKQIDLAVLKVDATGLPTIPIGSYEKLQKGQIVLAFGSPEGLENSVSFGLVSSVLRQPDPNNPMVYIQTDAAINPGNSGGPLMDLDGNMVGIDTFIYTKSGGNEGIGFAIPSGIARFAYLQIRKYGRVKRRTIGADLQTLTPEMAEGLNLKFLEGVIVSDLPPDSTAERAGLKIGDVITAMDGMPVNNVPLFALSLYLHENANFTKLSVMRGDKKLDLSVPIFEPPNDAEHLSELANPAKDMIPRLGIVGITVNGDTEPLLGPLRIPGGVVVASLVNDQLAVDSGLQVGDVIHSLKGAAITSVSELRDAFNALKPGDSATMQVERTGRLTYLTFDME